MVAIFFLLTFANMAGVSGGSLVIPFIILFNNFDAKQISQQAPFYNLVSAVVRFSINVWKKSPIKPERTIVDYDLVAIFMPLNLSGAVIGGLINFVFPNFIIDICLFLFLIFVIYQLFKKAFETYKKETIKMKKFEDEKNLIIAEAVL